MNTADDISRTIYALRKLDDLPVDFMNAFEDIEDGIATLRIYRKGMNENDQLIQQQQEAEEMHK